MKITISRAIGAPMIAVVEIDERGNEVIVPVDDFRRPAYRHAVEEKFKEVDWQEVADAFYASEATHEN